MKQTERAAAFHALHDDLVVLPNCWDGASAAVIEQTGAKALATSSAAVAWSLGAQDGNVLDRELMLEHLRRICSTAGVPVSCDIEGGFGDSAADLAKTTCLVIEAGAIGVNLEAHSGGRSPSPSPQSSPPSSSRPATSRRVADRPAKWTRSSLH